MWTDRKGREVKSSSLFMVQNSFPFSFSFLTQSTTLPRLGRASKTLCRPGQLSLLPSFLSQLGERRNWKRDPARGCTHCAASQTVVGRRTSLFPSLTVQKHRGSRSRPPWCSPVTQALTWYLWFWAPMAADSSASHTPGDLWLFPKHSQRDGYLLTGAGGDWPRSSDGEQSFFAKWNIAISLMAVILNNPFNEKDRCEIPMYCDFVLKFDKTLNEFYPGQ